MNPVAPLPDPNAQLSYNSPNNRDAEHLNLLSIFYYVMAGLTALGGLAFLFQIIMGFVIAGSSIGPTTIPASPSTFPGAPVPPPTTVPPLGPPASVGWIIVAMGIVGLLALGAFAGLIFWAGRSLARHEKKTLIQVVAGLLCLNVPLGTALGVCTFVVLSRPSVAALFEEPPAP